MPLNIRGCLSKVLGPILLGKLYREEFGAPSPPAKIPEIPPQTSSAATTERPPPLNEAERAEAAATHAADLSRRMKVNRTLRSIIFRGVKALTTKAITYAGDKLPSVIAKKGKTDEGDHPA